MPVSRRRKSNAYMGKPASPKDHRISTHLKVTVLHGGEIKSRIRYKGLTWYLFHARVVKHYEPDQFNIAATYRLLQG